MSMRLPCLPGNNTLYCVTDACILELVPHALDTQNSQEQAANEKYLQGWMDHFVQSRLGNVQGADSA